MSDSLFHATSKSPRLMSSRRALASSPEHSRMFSSSRKRENNAIEENHRSRSRQVESPQARHFASYPLSSFPPNREREEPFPAIFEPDFDVPKEETVHVSSPSLILQELSERRKELANAEAEMERSWMRVRSRSSLPRSSMSGIQVHFDEMHDMEISHRESSTSVGCRHGVGLEPLNLDIINCSNGTQRAPGLVLPYFLLDELRNYPSVFRNEVSSLARDILGFFDTCEGELRQLSHFIALLQKKGADMSAAQHLSPNSSFDSSIDQVNKDSLSHGSMSSPQLDWSTNSDVEKKLYQMTHRLAASEARVRDLQLSLAVAQSPKNSIVSLQQRVKQLESELSSSKKEVEVKEGMLNRFEELRHELARKETEIETIREENCTLRTQLCQCKEEYRLSQMSVEDLSERQDCLRSDLLNTQEKLVTANDIISSQDSDLHKLRQQKDQIDLNLQSCIRERDEIRTTSQSIEIRLRLILSDLESQLSRAILDRESSQSSRCKGALYPQNSSSSLSIPIQTFSSHSKDASQLDDIQNATDIAVENLETESLREALRHVSRGCVFFKLMEARRSGHYRWFFIDVDSLDLCWTSTFPTASFRDGNSIFAMRQLAEIRHASLHETFSLSVGKSNSNISSKAIGSDPLRCFSISFPSRRMDLEAPSQDVRDKWIRALSFIQTMKESLSYGWKQSGINLLQQAIRRKLEQRVSIDLLDAPPYVDVKSQPLSDGWEEMVDKATGRPYFRNRVLRKTQWDDPRDISSKLWKYSNLNADPSYEESLCFRWGPIPSSDEAVDPLSLPIPFGWTFIFLDENGEILPHQRCKVAKRTLYIDHNSRTERAYDPRVLPNGWLMFFDEEIHQFYFFHRFSGLQIWSDPRSLPPGWEMKWDASHNRFFFVDHVHRSSSWDDPRTIRAEFKAEDQSLTHAGLCSPSLLPSPSREAIEEDTSSTNASENPSLSSVGIGYSTLSSFADPPLFSSDS